MGIREKLLDYKRRLSDRKMYSIVIVIIAVVAIWGIVQYKNAANLRQQLDNQYNRAFYDMAGYVNNVQVLLVKSLISNSPEKTASTLQEAWRQANLAQTNLGQLPVSQPVLANTSKFLTQVGDLAYSLNNQNMQGKQISDQQYKTMEKLYGYAVSLDKNLTALQNQLGTGRLKWGELSDKGTPFFRKASTNLTKQQFEDVDKTFQDYPTLIYDGPFSDHLTTIPARGLAGRQMSVEEAKESARKFFGANKVASITNEGVNNTGLIKTYAYRVRLKNAPEEQTARIDISQKGGRPYAMLYNRPVNAEKIDIKRAKEIGREFLKAQGFENMKDTYYLREDNTATINYAYTQDGVTVYPDLIKVKVALDNGEIVGFESKAYLSAHTVREIPTPKISQEQARKRISPKVEILGSGLAIIPTEYKTELFTYEFKGKLNNRDFLVYINALTGREENILMIIDSPNGVVTM